MIIDAKLRQPCNIMDKLRFHLVLIAFILILLQKYAQGIKCLQCNNCNHPGVAENSTCVIDGGFCISSITREEVIDSRGIVIGRTDVIEVTRRCLTKDLSGLCSTIDAMKHVQNIKCCSDHDLCNIETPELAPWLPEAVVKRPSDSGDSRTRAFIIFIFIIIVIVKIVHLIAGIYAYAKKPVRPYAPPSDQKIGTNSLVGSQPSSLKVLYKCSQSGSDSGILESVGTSSDQQFQTDGRI